MIDAVFLFFPAATERSEGGAKLLAIRCGDKARRRAGDIDVGPRLRKKLWVVDDSFVAPLKPYGLLEFFLGLARGDHGFGEKTAVVEGLCAVAKKKHPGGEFEAQFDEIGWAAAPENV